MEPIDENKSASFRIKNPFSYIKPMSLKYPSIMKSKPKNTFHKGDFTSVISKTQKDGSVLSQTYNWAGFSLFIDMYQTYLYEKYRVQCRIDHKKLIDMYYDVTGNPAPFSILLFANKTRNLRNIHKIIDTQAESISKCIMTHYESETSFFKSTTGTKTSKSAVKEKNKILPFSTVLALPDNKYHSNCIIFRKEKNIVEIFEPHGMDFNDGYLRNIIEQQYKTLLDHVNYKLKQKGSRLHFNIVYSNQTCPDIDGIQTIESYYSYKSKKKKNSEGGGYCALWSLFIQELALLNQDMTVKEIVEQVLRSKTKAQLGKLLLEVARGYSEFVSSKLSDYFTVVLGTKATVANLKYIGKSNPEKIEKIITSYNYYMWVQYDLYDMEMSMKELETYYTKQMATQGKNDVLRKKRRILRKIMKMKAVTPLTRKKSFKKNRVTSHHNKTMSKKSKRETKIEKDDEIRDRTLDRREDRLVDKREGEYRIADRYGEVNKRDQTSPATSTTDTYTMSEGATRCRNGYIRHPKGSRNCKAKTQKIVRRLFQNDEKTSPKITPRITPNITPRITPKTIGSNMIYYKKEGQKRCPKGYNVDKKNKTRCLRK